MTKEAEPVSPRVKKLGAIVAGISVTWNLVGFVMEHRTTEFSPIQLPFFRSSTVYAVSPTPIACENAPTMEFAGAKTYRAIDSIIFDNGKGSVKSSAPENPNCVGDVPFKIGDFNPLELRYLIFHP